MQYSSNQLKRLNLSTNQMYHYFGQSKRLNIQPIRMQHFFDQSKCNVLPTNQNVLNLSTNQNVAFCQPIKQFQYLTNQNAALIDQSEHSIISTNQTFRPIRMQFSSDQPTNKLERETSTILYLEIYLISD